MGKFDNLKIKSNSPDNHERENRMTDLVSILLAQANKVPNKTIYTFLNSNSQATLTYSELALKAQAVAKKIIQQNVKKGERVLIVLPQGLDYLIAFFGCLFANVIAVPIYPPVRSAHLQRTLAIANDAQASLMIVDTYTLDMLKDYENLVDQSWSKINCMTLTALPLDEELNDITIPEPNDIAFLQYTSGSTGQPKGVIVRHNNLNHNFEMMKQGMSMSAESIVVSWLPLIHDMGLIGAGLLPVYLGATLYLMSPLKFIKKPLAWLEAISDYQATHSYAPNFAYETCIQDITNSEKNHLDLSNWQVALNAAEPIRTDTIKRFSQAFSCCGFNANAFYPAYGLAEATLFVSGGSIKSPVKFENIDIGKLYQGNSVLASNDSTPMQTLVGCGKSWLEEEILIVNPDTCEKMPVRYIGEVWLHGPHICSGYWNKHTESIDVFHAKTLDNKTTAYLRTGDLGYLNEEGELFIVGRIKDLIIIRGKNFAPQDIEYTVESCSESIKPNMVIAFSIESELEEQLIIVLQIRTRLTNDEITNLKKMIRKKILAEHEVNVTEILFVGRGGIPKTTSGKLQRQLCKKNYLANNLPVIETSCVENSNITHI